MKKIIFILFLIVGFSCKKESEDLVVREQLVLKNYFIDEDLGLILSNDNIDNITISDAIFEVLLGNETFKVDSPFSRLNFGEAYPIEKNQKSYQLYFTKLPLLCLLYTSPSPRDQRGSRMPSSA